MPGGDAAADHCLEPVIGMVTVTWRSQTFMDWKADIGSASVPSRRPACNVHYHLRTHPNRQEVLGSKLDL